MAKDVVVVIGAGGIGVAIARRQGIGKTILLADFNEKTLQAAAQDLQRAGYTVSTHHVDVSSRQSVGSLVDAAEFDLARLSSATRSDRQGTRRSRRSWRSRD